MEGNKYIQSIFIVCMAMFMVIPGILFFTQPKDGSHHEKQVAQHKNIKDIKTLYSVSKAFIQSFEDKASKDFGLRNELFSLYSFLKEDVFSTHIIPHKVIQGIDGWFFLGNDFSQTIRELMGLSIFNEEEIIKIEDKITALQSWVGEQESSLIVVVVPDKSTIYAKNVGWNFKEVDGKRQQFIDLLSAKNIDHIDLTNTLKKKSLKTYYKTDSHWNDYGSLMASIQLLNLPLFNELIPPKMHYFNKKDTVFEQMDLTKMLMKSIPENDVHYFNGLATKAIESSGLPDDIFFERAEDIRERHYSNKQGKMSVSIVGDSFCEGLIPYFKDYCGELHVFAQNKFDSSFVVNYPSDVLILQVAERNIDKFIDKYWDKHQ